MWLHLLSHLSITEHPWDTQAETGSAPQPACAPLRFPASPMGGPCFSLTGTVSKDGGCPFQVKAVERRCASSISLYSLSWRLWKSLGEEARSRWRNLRSLSRQVEERPWRPAWDTSKWKNMLLKKTIRRYHSAPKIWSRVATSGELSLFWLTHWLLLLLFTGWKAELMAGIRHIEIIVSIASNRSQNITHMPDSSALSLRPKCSDAAWVCTLETGRYAVTICTINMQLQETQFRSWFDCASQEGLFTASLAGAEEKRGTPYPRCPEHAVNLGHLSFFSAKTSS